MKILVSNDDGWDAPGIQLLESVLEEVAEVWTVAPANPQSGVSHQMTFERQMTLIQSSDRRFYLDGTPADCARVGLTQLNVEFDWVFSGVNNGGNLGVDHFISGTVAAAREATYFGKRAVAISQHRLDYPGDFDWDAAKPLLRAVVKNVIDRKSIFGGNLISVNLPDCTDREIGQVKIIDCELDRSPLPCDYAVVVSGQSSPPESDNGGNFIDRRTLLYRGKYNSRQRVPGKDVAVCMAGDVSVVTV